MSAPGEQRPEEGREAERHAFVEGYMYRVEDEGGEGNFTEFYRGKAADAWEDWSGDRAASPVDATRHTEEDR